MTTAVCPDPRHTDQRHVDNECSAPASLREWQADGHERGQRYVDTGICSCWRCEAEDAPASHCPTSAELAAFRRSLAYSSGMATRNFGPDEPFVHPAIGAWPDEIITGMGYTINGSAYRDAHDASRARKGARLIRSGMAVAFCGNRP